MDETKFKLPAYPLPFIHHLDAIEVAIQKGEDSLLIDMAELVQKHINKRLYDQNKDEFERLFQMLEASANSRSPKLHEEVLAKVKSIQKTVSPNNEAMNIEIIEKPLPLKKILAEHNLTERTRKKD